MSDVLLKEWCLVVGDTSKLTIIGENRLVDILTAVWKMMVSQLVPSISPLACFLWHSLFQQVSTHDNFSRWQEENLVQFQNLGTGRQEKAGKVILEKIEKMSQGWLQYQQVRNLITQVMKKDNVFRPLSEFETLLTKFGRPKLLSRLYVIL